MHFDPNGDDFLDAVSLLMQRHAEAGRGEATEADIRRAIVRFFDVTGLGALDEVHLEHDRNDLRTGDVLIEVKRRIGTVGGFKPDPANVAQLDGYLAERIAAGDPERLGVLTDGRFWMLRHPLLGDVRTSPPYGFELVDLDSGLALYEWLRDECQAFPATRLDPVAERVAVAFGGRTIRSEVLIDGLAGIYGSVCDDASVRLKRDLWKDLLVAALGEVVDNEPSLDRLFVRHTYLSTVVSLAVQSAFGVDVRAAAVSDAASLLDGTTFVSATGLRGVIESDFFGWPVEADAGRAWLADLARRVAGFDWRAAVTRHIAAAREKALTPEETLEGLRTQVIGIDIHPVSVHLARATWVLAAREVLTSATVADLSIPVYLGDSLQLLTDSQSILGADRVTIQLAPMVSGRHAILEFPGGLVARGDWFDKLMIEAAKLIDAGLDPMIALDDAGTVGADDREVLARTFSTLLELRNDGRDHIWAYYTRNLVRPVWLSGEAGRADVVVGNPPWLPFNRTDATLRIELERQCKETYRTWDGGRFATQQDVAGFFFTRCMDLYLKVGGSIAMVMPHSTLAAGQYRKWRTGDWGPRAGASFDREPWDLERIEPNRFFPVPACVVFATRVAPGEQRGLPVRADRWIGPEGGPFEHETIPLSGSDGFASPYAPSARNGATIFPRLLFFVETDEVEGAIVDDFVAIAPRRSGQEKPPWKHLSPQELTGWMERDHIWTVHLGETLVPFGLLEPLSAVLPARRSDRGPALASLDPIESRPEIAGVNPALLEQRMRTRWRDMSVLWEQHRGANNQLSLLDRLDYMHLFTAQLDERAGIRLVYSASGRPTAAVLSDGDPILENTLYGLRCETLREAHYLAAVVNSRTLEKALEPLVPKGQFGPRHVHKHVWRLPISAFDETDPLHNTLAEAGVRASEETVRVLAELRAESGTRGQPPTARVVRRRLRGWLRQSEIGQEIDTAVGELLAR